MDIQNALLLATGEVVLQIVLFVAFILGGFFIANRYIRQKAQEGGWWAQSKNGLRLLVLIVLFVLFSYFVAFINNLTGLSLFV